MTTQAPPEAPAIMAQDRAQQILQSRVYIPVLLDKLAEYGVPRPQTDAQLVSLLNVAGRLRREFISKQAAAVDPFAVLEAKADELLGPETTPRRFKNAATQAFADAELRAAAMSSNIHWAKAAEAQAQAAAA